MAGDDAAIAVGACFVDLGSVDEAQIGAAERRCVDADENLAVARLRDVDGAHFTLSVAWQVDA